MNGNSGTSQINTSSVRETSHHSHPHPSYKHSSLITPAPKHSSAAPGQLQYSASLRSINNGNGLTRSASTSPGGGHGHNHNYSQHHHNNQHQHHHHNNQLTYQQQLQQPHLNYSNGLSSSAPLPRNLVPSSRPSFSGNRPTPQTPAPEANGKTEEKNWFDLACAKTEVAGVNNKNK
ncbi:hypothetical protein EC957_012417 [Mortierella hygrophila]|uniref:Uncharacterized protein n=1 Tax=Mortierella hygrophila TaxID=979708 RepID=A0A9P6F6K1_9FUNG|nr:hypothetical protein EC957_012417 [Mortierella hygrophila]